MRGFVARRCAEFQFVVARNGDMRSAQRFLAAQPAVLPDIDPNDRLLFLIDSARSDLATSVLDLSHVRPARIAWQWVRMVKARWRLELLVRAADTVRTDYRSGQVSL